MAKKQEKCSPSLRDQLKQIEAEHLAAMAKKKPDKPKPSAAAAKHAARAKEIVQEVAKAIPKKEPAKPVAPKAKAKAKASIDLEEDADEALPTNQVMLQLSELVGNVDQLDSQIAEAAAKLEELQAIRKKIVEVDLPELMKSANAKKLTMLDGTVVEVTNQIHPGYKTEDEGKLFDWLRKHDHGSIIKNVVSVNFGKGEDENVQKLIAQLQKLKLMDWSQKQSIHANTFKAFVREQLEKGTKLPKLITIFNLEVANIKRQNHGKDKQSTTGTGIKKGSSKDKF